MKHRFRTLKLVCVVGFLAVSLGLAQQSKTQTPGTTTDAQSPSKALAPISWLVGEWHATATPPNGKPVQIDNRVYWSETRTAIFFLTKFDGEPHYSGMYAYDPARKQIGFWYVDVDGNFTQGTAEYEGEQLVHKFTTSKVDGTSNTLSSIIEKKSDIFYHWKVLRGTDPKPLVELDYSKK